MTTDNRTNEATEAQVEAAAKAMWDLRKRASDPEWEGGELDHGIKEIYRQDARAALVAAQGAAPQAESGCTDDGCLHYDHSPAPVLPSSGVDESNSPTLAVIAKAREFDLSVGMTAAAHMADAAIGASGLRVDLAAPVLPSSGVDEDALARLLCEKNYLSPDGKPTCAACRDKAHEVAAWLRGQGR